MNYLLLRSNKESGPYTLEQLVQLGLKPYDLLWIEGKSAAWRYPSELDELKLYAPTVEEQPYDRFYKKGTQEKHYFESLAEQKKDIKQPIVIQQPVEAIPVQIPVEIKHETSQSAEDNPYNIPVEQNKENKKPVEIKKPVVVKYYEIPAIQTQQSKTTEIIKTEEEVHFQIPIEQNKITRKLRLNPVEIKYYEIPVIPKQEISKPAEVKYFEIPEETKQEISKPVEVKYFEIPEEPKQEISKPAEVKYFESPEEDENDLKPVETGKKSTPGKVFVSMPVRSNSRQNETQPKKTVGQLNTENIAEEFPAKRIIEEKQFVEEEVELKQEYSQSLDEIKRMYAENYLQRKQKTSRKQSLVRFFQAAGIAACAIGLGALVYFVFLTGDKNEQPLNLAATSQPQYENNIPDNSEIKPSSSKKQVKYQETAGNNNNSEKKVYTVPKNGDVADPENSTGITEIENDQEEIVPDENAVVGKTEIDPVTGQRNKTTRSNTGETTNNNTGEVVSVRSTAVINKFVSVKSNNYIRKPFGGIQDLQLTVSNKSKFILDQVSVELLYLKPSEQPLKTEIVRFTDIAPNGTMTIKIPDSQRGIKVTYKILEVESSQFDKHLAGM